MKKPRNKKIYASLILSTGYDQEEALKRLVLGIFGFGTILGDKIQTTVINRCKQTQYGTKTSDTCLPFKHGPIGMKLCQNTLQTISDIS